VSGFNDDPELEASTDRWMIWGAVLIVALVLAFPLYRVWEPQARAESREQQLASLATQGEEIFALNCASCHGESGEGIDAPALNSIQFLRSATDDQIRLLVSVGVPGTEMSAYSLDFGGPLTSEQIRAVVTFIRSWEPNAPDRPDWRDPTPPPGVEPHGHGGEEEDGHDEGGEEEDGHDD
jgi:mono/diheme cytochrome c family protein